MDAVIFRRRFKELKKKHKLTYEDIAKLVGISCDGVKTHLRNNSNIPPLKILEAYAELFHVDINYLIGNKYYANATDMEGKHTMTLKKLLEMGGLITNQTTVKIIETNNASDISMYGCQEIARGNWFNDNILELSDKEILSFYWDSQTIAVYILKQEATE